MIKKNDVLCSLRLRKQDHDKLKRFAKENGITASEYIRRAIMEKLNNEDLLSLD